MTHLDSRETLSRRATSTFTEQWSRDLCELDSQLDHDSHALQLRLLGGRRYGKVLEIGCGGGGFTQGLVPLSDRIVALDVAPNAIERARSRGLPADAVDFRAANAMEFDAVAEGPWDLVVLSETIYCLGWLYSFFEVGWFASQLCSATREGGRLLMANTYGRPTDYLLLPWLVDSYRDLFLNVGFVQEHGEVFRGSKNGVDLSILVSLFRKDPGQGSAA